MIKVAHSNKPISICMPSNVVIKSSACFNSIPENDISIFFDSHTRLCNLICDCFASYVLCSLVTDVESVLVCLLPMIKKLLNEVAG